MEIIGIISGILIGSLLLTALSSWIYHRIRLHKEKSYIKQIGQYVNVHGHRMNVYFEGEGPCTLVFLAGGGTCSPVLDFKGLYSLMSDDYRIAVVEKFGYGFSDITGSSRDVDVILEDTREALKGAGIEGPYVLYPHSHSGLEALYWANKYPDEVRTIVGLDMAFPESYENAKVPGALKMGGLMVFYNLGLGRFVPSIANSCPAIEGENLTDEEEKTYLALFYRRSGTRNMMNEYKMVRKNAEKVDSEGIPNVPMLFFVSTGEGMGIDPDQWKKFVKNYKSNLEFGQVVNLNCGHYVHDFEPNRIAIESKEFLEELERRGYFIKRRCEDE